MLKQKKSFAIAYPLSVYRFFSAYAGNFLFLIVLLFHGCSSEVSDTRTNGQLPHKEHIKQVSIETVSQEDPGELSDMQRIVFDKIKYDLGEIKPRSTNIATFGFRNTGSKPLKITNVKKCCGAVVNLDKRELAPGERGVLIAEYQTGQGAGILNKKITLFTDDPENPQTELTITGKVIRTLEWTPTRFELSAYDKDNVCPEITIKSLDDTPFSIKGFTATGHCLSAGIVKI